MNQQHFRIVYDGPALQEHTMDVRDLAPALLALGEALEEANRVLNGERAKVSVQVKASFKTGCFPIDLDVTQSLARQLKELFTTPPLADAKQLLDLLGISVFDAMRGAGVSAGVGLLALLRWLRGRQPTAVEVLSHGGVKVLCDRESLEVERRVLELFRCYQLRRALEAAISKPLQRLGVASFAVHTRDGAFLEITREMADWFKTPDPETENLGRAEYETSLQLVSLSFREDNKWRFSEGGMTFYATLADPVFLDAIDRNATAFAKGDILRARVMKQQWLAGDDLKTDYVIQEVLEHRHAPVQLQLPWVVKE